MRLGLHLSYKRSDSTYAALRIAQIAADLGLDVDIYSDTPITEQVSSTWDNRVHHTPINFDTGLTHLILTEPESADTLLDLRKRGIKVYLLPSWHNITIDNAKDLHAFTAVVSPAKSISRFLEQSLGVVNSHCAPFDPGVPITRADTESLPRWLGLIWSVENSQAAYQGPEALSLVMEVMANLSKTWLTVLCRPDIPAEVWRRLRKFAEASDGRIELIRGASWEKQALLYARHDLTLCPAIKEDYGLTALCSAYMGTPVLAFDVPPVSDFIRTGHNGRLVGCELAANALGAPVGVADAKAYIQAAVDLVNSPEALFKLRQTTTLGLSTRRDAFVSFWSGLLLN